MRISGGTLTSKKIALDMPDEIASQIQRYLFVQVATSALLGAIAWLVLAWIGLENPAVWVSSGGVLQLIALRRLLFSNPASSSIQTHALASCS